MTGYGSAETQVEMLLAAVHQANPAQYARYAAGLRMG
jgi:hypothetical protein